MPCKARGIKEGSRSLGEGVCMHAACVHASVCMQISAPLVCAREGAYIRVHLRAHV